MFLVFGFGFVRVCCCSLGFVFLFGFVLWFGVRCVASHCVVLCCVLLVVFCVCGCWLEFSVGCCYCVILCFYFLLFMWAAEFMCSFYF